MANLYWKPLFSSSWNDVGNWWTNASGTTPALKAPWVDSDPAYLDFNLTRATGVTTSPTIFVNIGTGVSGVCDIPNIVNGDENFGAYPEINGGTFTGSGFVNYYTGTINNGTFTGSGFINDENGAIYNGTFTGSGFLNRTSNISGGTFSGSGLTNGANASISGGTFSGSGFTSASNGFVRGGTFIHPAVNVSTSGGSTLLTTSSNPNNITLSYPTPASGGSDQTIARLLNLPWFINL
jgi:hypothetical protein